MDRESLENRSRLHSLEAENKHLKSLLSRVVTSNVDVDIQSSASIVSKLEIILEGDVNYKNVIKPVLKEFGLVTGVDRVSIFSLDNRDNCFYAAQQWVNSNIQEYHPSDLSIKEVENPLNAPTHGNCFVSFNIQNEIQQSLSEKLETFQVQSILIIPFKSGEFSNGMFVLESCHFNREWYDFEIKEMEDAVHFFSNFLNSLWQKNITDQALELSDLRNKMNRKLKAGKKSKKGVNEVLQIIGVELAFNRIYIIDKDSFSNNHELVWASSLEGEERCLTNEELVNLNLNFEEKSLYYFTPNLLVSSGIGLLVSDAFLMLSSVTYQKEFKGWLVAEINADHNYSERILTQFWESISLMVSEVLGGINLENELSSCRHKLLEVNRTLAVKESFLNNILNFSPLGILIVKNKIVHYANDYATSVLGYTQNEMMGKTMSSFYNFHNAEFEEKAEQFYETIYSDGHASDEITLVNKLGQQKRISFFGSRDINENNSP